MSLPQHDKLTYLHISLSRNDKTIFLSQRGQEKFANQTKRANQFLSWSEVA